MELHCYPDVCRCKKLSLGYREANFSIKLRWVKAENVAKREIRTYALHNPTSLIIADGSLKLKIDRVCCVIKEQVG